MKEVGFGQNRAQGDGQQGFPKGGNVISTGSHMSCLLGMKGKIINKLEEHLRAKWSKAVFALNAKDSSCDATIGWVDTGRGNY